MKDRLFEIWFALACGQANTEFQPLLEQYGTPYDLFNADEREIEKLPCSPRLKRALCQKSLQQSQQIMEFCKHGSGIEVISPADVREAVAKELAAAAGLYGKP